MLIAGPCNNFAVVAIGIMKSTIFVWRLQGNNHMPHFSFWTYYKYNISRA